ncbi:APC family permease [Yinghuangia aomiensis]
MRPAGGAAHQTGRRDPRGERPRRRRWHGRHRPQKDDGSPDPHLLQRRRDARHRHLRGAQRSGAQGRPRGRALLRPGAPSPRSSRPCPTAELAGTIPVSGSSYSYAYATLGEGIAWVCGWCLCSSTVCRSPPSPSAGASTSTNSSTRPSASASRRPSPTRSGENGGVVGIAAVIVVRPGHLAAGARRVGERQGGTPSWCSSNSATLAFFCAVAFTAVRLGQPRPVRPARPVGGVSAGASQVFFSYIGFDAASTAGEEAKSPRRDLPLAILFSLLIVTIVYVVVALAALGAMPWTEFADAEATHRQDRHRCDRRLVGVDHPVRGRDHLHRLVIPDRGSTARPASSSRCPATA